MNTEQLTINDLTIDVVRKNIKNLHLGVYPPHGHVRVAVPLYIDNEAVRLAIVSRLGWIKRQQAKFDKQPRLSAREYITGESLFAKCDLSCGCS